MSRASRLASNFATGAYARQRATVYAPDQCTGSCPKNPVGDCCQAGLAGSAGLSGQRNVPLPGASSHIQAVQSAATSAALGQCGTREQCGADVPAGEPDCPTFPELPNPFEQIPFPSEPGRALAAVWVVPFEQIDHEEMGSVQEHTLLVLKEDKQTLDWYTLAVKQNGGPGVELTPHQSRASFGSPLSGEVLNLTAAHYITTGATIVACRTTKEFRILHLVPNGPVDELSRGRAGSARGNIQMWEVGRIVEGDPEANAGAGAITWYDVGAPPNGITLSLEAQGTPEQGISAFGVVGDNRLLFSSPTYGSGGIVGDADFDTQGIQAILVGNYSSEQISVEPLVWCHATQFEHTAAGCSGMMTIGSVGEGETRYQIQMKADARRAAQTVPVRSQRLAQSSVPLLVLAAGADTVTVGHSTLETIIRSPLNVEPSGAVPGQATLYSRFAAYFIQLGQDGSSQCAVWHSIIVLNKVGQPEVWVLSQPCTPQ